MTPVRLVLLRHGQSESNAAGIFTGWENLEPHAVRDAIEAIRNQGRVLGRPSPGGPNEQQTGR